MATEFRPSWVVIADLEARARRLGIRIAKVIEIAGVHHSTWANWRKEGNNDATYNALMRVLQYIDDMEQAAGRTAGQATAA